MESKKTEETKNKNGVNTKVVKKKVSKTWEAAMRLKGSLIVNDPKFLL